MRYARLRRAARPVGFTRRWPAAGVRLDYPAGHVGAARAAAAAAGYFYLNRGWRRTRNLFSHVRPVWTPAGWRTNVFYVDRRRARPVRGGRPGRAAHLGAHPAAGYLTGVARRWGDPRGTTWVWCRLPTLVVGTLDTLVAHLGYRLRGRAERRVKQVALPLLGLTQRLPGAVGGAVRCHGRFTRRQRADRAVHSWGVLHRTARTARVADTAAAVTLRFGAVGVTLLVNYGFHPRG